MEEDDKEDYGSKDIKQNRRALEYFNINSDIKIAVNSYLHQLEIEDMNFTIIVAALVIMIKYGKIIDNNFSNYCNEVIKDIISNDTSISRSGMYSSHLIKKDILRYFRYLLKQL